MRSPSPHPSKARCRAYAHGLLALLASLASGLAWADDDADVSVTPYRPTISNPAQMSAPGWLEGEFGALATSGPGRERRDSLPYTIKLAFTPDWGVRVGGDGYVSETDAAGQTQRGFADTTLTGKVRFAVDAERAFGIELSLISPTARSGLGNGRTAYGTNLIYSADIGNYHLDVNLFPTLVGRPTPTASAWQLGGAIALSHPVSEKWGVLAEISGVSQNGIEHTSQFLAGSTYSASKRMVLDCGAVAGIGRGSPHFGIFAGATVLLGRVL